MVAVQLAAELEFRAATPAQRVEWAGVSLLACVRSELLPPLPPRSSQEKEKRTLKAARLRGSTGAIVFAPMEKRENKHKAVAIDKVRRGGAKLLLLLLIL